VAELFARIVRDWANIDLVLLAALVLYVEMRRWKRGAR
jgi:hypothetical protein